MDSLCTITRQLVSEPRVNSIRISWSWISILSGELDPEKDVDQVFAYAGSGGFNVTGENFFSQAHRVQYSVKKVSSPSVDLLQKTFVPATVDNTVLFNQVGSADDKIIWQAGERKVTIRPIGFGSVLLSDTPPTNTATLSVSGAATNIERTFADGNVNLFDISGDAWQSTGCKIHSTL